jgi:hypothetical protein
MSQLVQLHIHPHADLQDSVDLQKKSQIEWSSLHVGAAVCIAEIASMAEAMHMQQILEKMA